MKRKVRLYNHFVKSYQEVLLSSEHRFLPIFQNKLDVSNYELNVTYNKLLGIDYRKDILGWKAVSKSRPVGDGDAGVGESVTVAIDGTCAFSVTNQPETTWYAIVPRKAITTGIVYRSAFRRMSCTAAAARDTATGIQ